MTDSDPVEDAFQNFLKNHRKKIIKTVVVLLVIMGVLNIWQPYLWSSIEKDLTSRGSYLGKCHFLTFKIWKGEIIKPHYAISKKGEVYALGLTKKNVKKDIICKNNAHSHLK